MNERNNSSGIGKGKVAIQILVVAIVIVAGFFIYSINGIVKDEGFKYDGDIGIIENLKNLGGEDGDIDDKEGAISGKGAGRSSGGGGGGGGSGSGGGFGSGGSVASSVGTSVSREVVGNFVSGEETEIILHIVSDEKAIGIREGEGEIDDWNILDSDLSEDFEIFEFKGSSNEWVIADPGKEVKVDLTYTVVSSPGTEGVRGKYFTSDGSSVFEGDIDGDLGQIQLSPISEGQGTIWVIGIILLVLIVALIVVVVKGRR